MFRSCLHLLLLTAAAASAQPTPDELLASGKFALALEAYKAGIAQSPRLMPLYLGAGSAADLMGRHDEARQFFQQAIRVAANPMESVQGQRAMAISYAFTADCREAEKYSRRAFDYYLSTGDRTNAGEAGNEIGRICLESGDLNRAADWYDRGHNAVIEEEDLKPARLDLSNFRWLHARARIAARQGKFEESRRQVARAKAILAKKRIPEQEAFLPYLEGYVAFYAGDYKAALTHLGNVPQPDVFLLNLMARCYEKQGDMPNATQLYRKVASVTSHTLPAALAQPFALRKLR